MPVAFPWQGHPVHTSFLPAVHAVPGDHRGSAETNLWRVAVGAQRGEDATLAGLALSERVRPEEPSEIVCRVFPLFCPLLSLFFWFPYHTRNAVPLPSRCQVDYAACHTLAPLYLLFNLFLVKSLNWRTVITATWILSYHFIWTNQSPVKCVLKHIIHNSTQINKAAGRGAGIDSHPFSWGFFLQFVLKGLQGCIHSQLVSAHCFIFFLSLLLLFMVHHFYCRRFWKGLCVNL